MIAIIDYEAGNLASVARAISHLGFENITSRNTKEILSADRIIFPGVGAAGSAMNSVKKFGIDKALKDALASGIPVLGICLGTQIILGASEENNTECLDIIGGKVRAFPSFLQDDKGYKLKIPHMGWNKINILKDHPLLYGIENEDEFYFVHSFYPEPENPDNVIATTDYGLNFTSVMGKENLFATQFHPEKSGKAGLKILKNFCTWTL